eukprot:277064_1
MMIHKTSLGFPNLACFGMLLTIGITLLSNLTNASDYVQPGSCQRSVRLSAPYCHTYNEERPEDASWRCTGCEIIRKGSKKNCHICNMPKPSPIGPEDDAWRCTGCQIIRKGIKKHCDVCNIAKPSPIGSASTDVVRKKDNFWIGGGFLFVLIISAIILAVKKQNILQQVKKDDPEELPLFQENEVKPKEKGSRRRCKHGDRYFWERCHSITLGAIMVCTCTCTGVVEYRNWRRNRRQRPHRAPICSFELVNRLFSDSSY